jgi:transcriptional regulator with XRE-family HTH domain
MTDMTNSILQEPCQVGKSYLPSPYPAHKLVIKKKSLKSIMEVKGWSTYTQMAEALGFTRQYIAMIANGIPVSAEFITRMALALGNKKANWYVHYEIVPRALISENHPTWNKQKHDGQIPYNRFSISAEFRKNDYLVEKNTI